MSHIVAFCAGRWRGWVWCGAGGVTERSGAASVGHRLDYNRLARRGAEVKIRPLLLRTAGAGFHAAISTVLLLVTVGCGVASTSVPRRTIRITESSLTAPLVEAFTRRLPQFEFRVVPRGGEANPTLALSAGEAELAVVMADTAYFEHLGLQRVAPEVRGLSLVPEFPVHLVVGKHSTVRSLADLRDRSVVTCAGCPPGAIDRPGTRDHFIRRLIEAHGVTPDQVVGYPLASDQVIPALKDGTYDAAFVLSYYPAASVAEATRAGARLLPIEGPAVDRLRLDYPFVREVRIPPGTYPGQPEMVRTVGIDRLLLCRGDLEEPVAYLLTRAFVESLRELAVAQSTSFRHMDMDRAPATPVPLHEGAARFFREWELFQ